MQNSDSKKTLFIVIGIIISLSSLVWGMLSSAIKQTFLMPGNAFFFGSNGISTLLSTAAIFILGVALVIVGFELSNRKIKWGLVTSLFAVSILTLVYSADEYYYYSTEGIFINDLNGFGIEKTDWNEIALVTSVFQKDQNGSQQPKTLIFEMNNGEVMEMKMNGTLIQARSQIERTILNLGGDSIIKIFDPEGNVIHESRTEGKK